MANQLNCLRCGAGMRFIKREKFQLGQTGWVLGDLPRKKCPVCGAVLDFDYGRCPYCEHEF